MKIDIGGAICPGSRCQLCLPFYFSSFLPFTLCPEVSINKLFLMIKNTALILDIIIFQNKCKFFLIPDFFFNFSFLFKAVFRGWEARPPKTRVSGSWLLLEGGWAGGWEEDRETPLCWRSWVEKTNCTSQSLGCGGKGMRQE